MLKTFLTFLIAVAAAHASAQDSAIRGVMLCEVVGNRFVASREANQSSKVGHREGFSIGASLLYEYTLDDTGELMISLSARGREIVLFEDPFAAERFNGISPTTKIAEFRTSYRELSFGHFSMNYKGNDQLRLKRCKNNNWDGHYVRTYASGQFVQVVTIDCQPVVDAVDDVLARLKNLH